MTRPPLHPDDADLEAEDRANERRSPSEGTVGQDRIAGDAYENWLDGRWTA